MPRYRCLACRYSLEGHKDRGPIIRCPECGYENDLDSPEFDLDSYEADPRGLSAVICLCGSLVVIIWGCVLARWSNVGPLLAGLGLLIGIVMWIMVSGAINDLLDKRRARFQVLRFVLYTVAVCVYVSVAICAAAWLAGVAGRRVSNELYRIMLFPVGLVPFVIFAWACRSLLIGWLKAFGAMFEALDRTEPRP